MKLFHLLLFIIAHSFGFSQSIIEWTPDYNLKLPDFQSAQTEINNELTSCSINAGINMEFSFQMSNYEFMFTKNFNSRVSTTFNQNAAVISSPDTVLALQLVNFGNYSFDLTELFSRKFRKELFEQKGTFSNVSFFQPIFNKLQEELNAENTRVLKLTDLGRKAELLEQEHQFVLNKLKNFQTFVKPASRQKRRKRASITL